MSGQMALIYQKVEIANPSARHRRAVVDCLVEAGALYSYVPRTLLRKLGIRPLGSETFETADSRAVRRPVGEAVFRIDGKARVSPVIFARAGDEPLLGVVTLESLGLTADPISGSIRRARLLLKTATGRSWSALLEAKGESR